MYDPDSSDPLRPPWSRPIFQGLFSGVLASILFAASPVSSGPALAQEPAKKPNILFIMGDDVGWFNVGAYHRGMMSGKTPNIDRLAAEGMMFTDYYAEASCTAGRANFIMGELPIRTGMTTVGQPGADIGIPAEASTIATALKAHGYVTAQFGKNHLGDLNKFLPTVHGFDEYFGYLYHLDAMSDPFWYSYPTDPAIRNLVLPRNLIHSWAADVDDPTVQPRWGKIGKQKIVDEGPLSPGPHTGRTIYGGDEELVQATAKYDMTTLDDVLVRDSIAFMKKAKAEGKPFFLWHNTTREHVWSFLAPHYKAMMNPETNYGLEEAGMVQIDDNVGALMKALDDMGEADNTIVVFTTDNGAETFTWPDGGMTPFRASKGTIFEGGFRVPAIIRWPGHVKPGTVENGIFSGLDWYPTFCAAAGDPNITEELLKGVKLGGRTYKNHLDGYNQVALLEGKGPSERHEIFYFGGPSLGAVRVDNFKYQFYDQPDGWPGAKVETDMPKIYNIRQDPFERTSILNFADGAPAWFNEFFGREAWRFVLVQQVVLKLGETAIEFPPMQAPASFSLTRVKEKIQEMIKARESQ
jgi:arylsulfatase A-like enzyme